MPTITKTCLLMLLCGAWLLTGCSSEERPARTVREFLDSPQFLEAAVVRCSQNRSESRYKPECVNARQAVSVIEAREERAQRAELEARSESKRDALRRTQHAAAEAQRRSAEQDRLRSEEEYLSQFRELPSRDLNANVDDTESNAPGAVVSTTEYVDDDSPPVIFDEIVRENAEPMPASDGGNAPTAEIDPEAD